MSKKKEQDEHEKSVEQFDKEVEWLPGTFEDFAADLKSVSIRWSKLRKDFAKQKERSALMMSYLKELEHDLLFSEYKGIAMNLKIEDIRQIQMKVVKWIEKLEK